MSLYDRPDPRRLDLRASLRALDDDWLVRVNRQRTGVAVRVIVDVSASMLFGSARPKLHVVADFAEALGDSAFRVGDAVGMMAFDHAQRTDLFVPARVSRGMGSVMSELLRSVGLPRSGSVAPRHSTDGAWRHSTRPPPESRLEDAVASLAGQHGLVFVASDFHWPLEHLEVPLDLLAHSTVVPLVIWDSAEIHPPERNALASLRDAETGAARTLWVRPALRQRWGDAVMRRRAEIDSYFASHALRPFYIVDSFDADALSRYFLEEHL